MASPESTGSAEGEAFRDFDFGGFGSGGPGARKLWDAPDEFAAGSSFRDSSLDPPSDQGPAERYYAGEWGGSGSFPLSLVEASERARGPEIAGYEILGELGRGGMGVVYKARQLRLNRVVALKMILNGDHAGPDAFERFRAEAEMVARLQHPNIVQIYAIGDSDGRPYVELEYVEGGSLSARLDGTPWPARAAATMVESLARAVAEAHRMGVVHRDLKPANVLLTELGEPKVSDFGLAKTCEADTGLTQTESILGSPSYMAPEQAEGRSREVGPAADVYALGANLYELLTGRPPFVGPTVLATLDLVKNADPVPPRRLQPGLARDIETICLKCLDKEPHRRYESALALAEDLARFLDHEPILARPSAPWEWIEKWVRRRPSFAALTAVTVLAITAAFASVWYARASQKGQREAAKLRHERIRGQAEGYLVLAREAVRREDWEASRAQSSTALALMGWAKELTEKSDEATRMLMLSRAKIAQHQARDRAKAHLTDFYRLHDEAVFHQSDYTGLDPEANHRASRAAAREALALFTDANEAATKGVPARLTLDPAVFDAREIEAITLAYYELTLILADVVSQPLTGEDPKMQAREALCVLDGARTSRAPTASFHQRRAGYLERLGDTAGAALERTLAASAPSAGETPVDNFLSGERALRNQDYPAAVAAFHRVLALKPDHFWAQYLLAICQLKSHRPSEAQAALIGCQARRPGFVWTYVLKGLAEGETQEFDLAEADFHRADTLGLNAQGRYVMLVNRGVMRLRRGHDQAAADDLAAAMALKPDRYQAYINLSQAQQKLGKGKEALATLDKAIVAIPGEAILFRARAQLHRQRGDDVAALNDYNKAIETAPYDDAMLADDHQARALILRQSGRLLEALAACDSALTLRPDRREVHRLRGVILMGLKRYAEAVQSFDACLARGTKAPALYEARGLALAAQGHYARAITDYTIALESGSSTSTLHENRGWAYVLTGAPSLAVHDFDDALRAGPATAHVLSGRALALVQLRMPREAVADAHALVNLSPSDPRQLYSAARVLCQAAACLEVEPTRANGGWNLANRYRNEALDLVARAVEMTPASERSRFWSGIVRTDSALAPLRQAQRYLTLEATIAQSSNGRGSTR